jgi:RecA/RadA recombinase
LTEVHFNMGLLDKLKKNTTIKESSILEKSKFFTEKDMIPTDVPMINVALSGRLDGGLVPGLTMLAGPSKHFKTAFALLMASAYMKKYSDAVVLFYDSEFGTPQKYFETFDIDMGRVLHTPITDVEELKHDIMNQLQGLEKTDHVIIVIDSIGNLASRKEVEDSLEGKSVADMTRAKQIKSLFRMITPHLTIKDVPMVVVNHTYKEIGMFPKDIVGGGTGSYYSADTIWILGRQQEKTGGDIVGYNFIINVEKSRYVREKSKIPVTVSFEGGINKYSGLLEIALEGNFVSKPTAGWYAKVNQETGEIDSQKFRESDTNTKEFWKDILKNAKFKEFISKKYSISYGSIMGEDVSEEEVTEV